MYNGILTHDFKIILVDLGTIKKKFSQVITGITRDSPIELLLSKYMETYNSDYVQIPYDLWTIGRWFIEMEFYHIEYKAFYLDLVPLQLVDNKCKP